MPLLSAPNFFLLHFPLPQFSAHPSTPKNDQRAGQLCLPHLGINTVTCPTRIQRNSYETYCFFYFPLSFSHTVPGYDDVDNCRNDDIVGAYGGHHILIRFCLSTWRIHLAVIGVYWSVLPPILSDSHCAYVAAPKCTSLYIASRMPMQCVPHKDMSTRWRSV